jgi:hypothetical protein
VWINNANHGTPDIINSLLAIRVVTRTHRWAMATSVWLLMPNIVSSFLYSLAKFNFSSPQHHMVTIMSYWRFSLARSYLIVCLHTRWMPDRSGSATLKICARR